MEEREGSPKINIQYEQLQAATLVTAAAVACITNPNVPQLIIFKEMGVEVWEIETEAKKVISEVLERPVFNCCVIRPPIETALPSRQDCILVTDGSGGLGVLNWNAALSVLQEVGPVEVRVKPELNLPSACLLKAPLFSCPLDLPPKSSALTQVLKDGAQGSCTAPKVNGITLVAMSLHQSLLGILSVEWMMQNPKPSQHESAVGNSNVALLAPRILVRFLALPQPNSMTHPMVAFTHHFVIHGLAFLGAHGSHGYGALDLKMRPLLVLLASQLGYFCHSLQLKCMVVDLPTHQLHPGPWEIRNLHPTTTLLLPWFFPENLKVLGASPASKGENLETGLRPGLGVIAVSTASLLFIESGGRRASLPLNLEGRPTCWNVLSNNRLVLGDSVGALHIVELSSWNSAFWRICKVAFQRPLPPVQILVHVKTDGLKASSGNQECYVFFITGQIGDSRLIRLTRSSVRDELPAQANNEAEAENLEARGTTPFHGELTESMTWTGQELTLASSDHLLQSTAPVRDMIVVKDSKFSPDPFLLLLCGNSPTSTLRKGSLMASFQVDIIQDTELAGSPQILPFREDWRSEYHTHLLLSYPIAVSDDGDDLVPGQHVSEVVTLMGMKTEDTFMVGLERGQCTLAVSALTGRWFAQVTENSLRILDNRTSSQMLRAEWKPPPSKECSKMIHHAALTSEGVVLVSGAIVYSVQLDYSGVPHTVSTTNRPHQVSALGMSYIGDSGLQELVLVVGQWVSNTVHLLSWPNLEEVATMDPLTAPVRSLAIGQIATQTHLFVGTADGNLVYYLITKTESRTGRNQDKKNNVDDFGHLTVEEDLMGTCNSMLMTGSQHSGHKCKDPLQKAALFQKEHLNMPQLTLTHGRVIKVGSSVEFIEFGCFSGGGEQTTKCRNESCKSGFEQEFLYVWSERSLVLVRDAGGGFQVVKLYCNSHPVQRSIRLHAKEYPNSLVSLNMEGQVTLGHLNLPIKMRWQELQIPGSVAFLAHHQGSGCAAIASIDGALSRLHFVHEESMCQVLTVELEAEHFPTSLASFHVPLTLYNQDTKPVECIVLATQVQEGEHTKGNLSFFDLQVTYPSDKHVEYKLRLLGLHSLEQPCHSLCMMDSSASPSSPLKCTMCNVDLSNVGDDPLLRDVIQSLTLSGEHWSQCCSVTQSLERETRVPEHPLLVLGYTGRVELVSVFVGVSEACMLLVPCVAAALDAPFISSFGDGEGGIQLSESEGQPPSMSSLESEPPASSTETGAAAAAAAVRPTPSMQIRLQSKSLSKWVSSSLINVRSFKTFITPGGGCVSTVVPASAGTVLVAEMLHGLSVFAIDVESTDVVQLAWQAHVQPLHALLPLSDDLYLLAKPKALILMARDYTAEAAFQIEEKLRLDLEKELMCAPEEREEGGVYEEETSSVSGDVKNTTKPERLPGLTCVAAASLSSTACRLAFGPLSLRSRPLINTPENQILPSLISVTPTGEIGTITITDAT